MHLNTDLILGIFGGTVTVLVAFIGIVPKLKEMKSKKEDSNNEKKYKSRVSLDKHPVFLELKSLEYFFTYDFRLKDVGRTMIVKEVTLRKIRVASEILMKYAKQVMACSKEYENQETNEEIAIVLMDMFTEMVNKVYNPWYRLDAMSAECRRYDEETMQTMDIYLDKYREWNHTRIEIIKTATLELPKANMGDSYYNTMWDMMSIYMYAYTQMKYDAVTTVERLNGELTGHKFLGVELGNKYK